MADSDCVHASLFLQAATGYFQDRLFFTLQPRVGFFHLGSTHASPSFLLSAGVLLHGIDAPNRTTRRLFIRALRFPGKKNAPSVQPHSFYPSDGRRGGRVQHTHRATRLDQPSADATFQSYRTAIIDPQ